MEVPTMLWVEAETKVMFQKYRLWPSFIGAKVNDEKLTKGVLPVVLWKEQKKYLQNQNALKDNHIILPGITDTNSRKRKHDDINDDENADNDEDTVQPVKKTKNNSDSFVNGVVVGLMQPFQWISSMSQYFLKPQKVDDKKDSVTATTIWQDLHNMDYFVGPGDVYGGDYSIYRGGDPSNSHSTATVRVVRQRKISARDLLAYSRVQNQVAKSAVLAYINPDKNKPEYIVVNFKNVSDRL
jgi:tRNA splicing endonuclease